MRQIVALLKFLLFLLVLAVCTVLMLLCGLLPIRTSRGARVATVPAGWMSKAFLWIFNIRFHCPDPGLIRSHTGLIVCNHLSFTDTLVLLSLTPVRFLSTAGVRGIPVIGWLATAIETVFVNRGNQESRTQARTELAQKLRKRAYPPIAIFAEGGIGDGIVLKDFRHGAFEIAMESSVGVLPCTLRYEPLEPIHYYAVEASLPKAVWQIATYAGGVDVTLIPGQILDSQTYDDAAQLAEESHAIVARNLG